MSADSYSVNNDEIKKQGITEYEVKTIDKKTIWYILSKYLRKKESVH